MAIDLIARAIAANNTQSIKELALIVAKLQQQIGGNNIAGLYQTGAIALYNEQGAEAIKDMQITSWDELISSRAMVIENGAVSAGCVLPDNLPEKNEYGFYYGVPYTNAFGTLVFYNDGSMDMYAGTELMDSVPAGSVVYGANSIDMSAFGMGMMTVSSDGKSIVYKDGNKLNMGSKAQLNGDLIIPNDENITLIGEDAFRYQSNLTAVAIGDSITSIGNYAFSDCTSLTSVTIGDSVTSIGNYAFSDCTSLTSVTIGDSVTSIGDYAFSDCTSLTSIEIPNSVTSIGDCVFEGCIALESVTIGDSVTSIGNSIFYGCTSLTSIEIPDSVTSIGAGTFEGCTSLTSVTIGDSVTSIGVNAFRGCTSLTSVTIGDSVTSIDENAFWDCTSLKNIEIPDSVTSIGVDAFYDCIALESVTIGDSVTSIGEWAFYNCNALTNITYNGTVDQWYAVKKKMSWNKNVPATHVQCSDGQVEL